MSRVVKPTLIGPALHAWRARYVACVVFCLLTMSLGTEKAHAASGFAGLDPSTMQQLEQASRHRPGSHAETTNAQTHSTDESAPQISAADAARIALDKVGGRVLNVVLEHGPDGPYYLVKILHRGRVQLVHIDAHR